MQLRYRGTSYQARNPYLNTVESTLHRRKSGETPRRRKTQDKGFSRMYARQDTTVPALTRGCHLNLVQVLECPAAFRGQKIPRNFWAKLIRFARQNVLLFYSLICINIEGLFMAKPC